MSISNGSRKRSRGGQRVNDVFRSDEGMAEGFTLWKANAKIFHTNYFAQGNTSLALRDWLIEGLNSLPPELRESETVNTSEVCTSVGTAAISCTTGR